MSSYRGSWDDRRALAESWAEFQKSQAEHRRLVKKEARERAEALAEIKNRAASGDAEAIEALALHEKQRLVIDAMCGGAGASPHTAPDGWDDGEGRYRFAHDEPSFEQEVKTDLARLARIQNVNPKLAEEMRLAMAGDTEAAERVLEQQKQTIREFYGLDKPTKEPKQ